MTKSKAVTVNSRAFDGEIRRSWVCELVRQKGDALEFIGTFDRDVEHSELGLIEAGTTSYEYYWLDRWFNIFRFHTPAGEFRNFYCNVNMPPTFRSYTLDYVDLDLDVVVWDDGAPVILDREEFEANALKYDYPEVVRQSAEKALSDIIAIINRGDLPN